MSEKGRLIASTDPEDYGFQLYSNLGWYFYIEGKPEIPPETLRPLYDIHTGRETGEYEDEEGNVYDYYAMEEMGIIAYPHDGGYWDDDMANIRSAFDSAQYGYVLMGSVGLWSGTRTGGRYIEDLKELRSMMAEYDEVRIYDDKGEFNIYLYHHDGTNIMTAREITKKGDDYRYDQMYNGDLSEFEILEKIFDSPAYSKKPDIANRVFGVMSSNRKPMKRKIAKKVVSKNKTPTKPRSDSQRKMNLGRSRTVGRLRIPQSKKPRRK